MEAEWFCLMFGAMHLYFQDAIIQKETLMTNRTQLEKTALFFKSTVAPPLGIIVRKSGIARCNDMSKQKVSLQLYATAAVSVQAVVYENLGQSDQQKCGSKRAYKR